MERLGAYRLGRRIGQGGMAEVYEAQGVDAVAGRAVRITRMLPNLADDMRFIAMFLREARIAARLEHPNIVNLIEVCVADVSPSRREHFLVMEKLDGLTAFQLGQRLR